MKGAPHGAARSATRRRAGRRGVVGAAVVLAALALPAVSTGVDAVAVGPVSARAPAPAEVAPVEPTAQAREAARQVAAAPTPRIAWTPCSDAPKLQCARARVPLDYDEPRGARITLALVRRPADDQADKVGTLFTNFGGPGGPGVSTIKEIGDAFGTPQVRQRFDIVGFDPRGIAESTALQCYETSEDAQAAAPPFPFPYTRAEERVWAKANRDASRSCARRAGPILDHMSTANVARDMDLLRRAVGDEQMSFLGYSYGSYVGETYANLFPDKARAIVIDGVIDPIAYASGRGDEAKTVPTDARQFSEQGAYESLQQFLTLCDRGGPRCAFSGGDPTKRYDALLRRLLRSGPVQLPDGEGGRIPFGYHDAVQASLGALYAPSAWPDLAEFLQALDTGRLARAARILRESQPPRPEPATDYVQSDAESFGGVWCLDGANPTSVTAWARAARAADRTWPYFGRPWIWAGSICASWPGQDDDRYAGPFDARTANPVLIVNTRYDPATRYQDAVSTSRIMPRSRLLTVEGWGHTTTFAGGERPNTCVDDRVTDYLLTGEVPPRGATCGPAQVPFAAAPAPGGEDQRPLLPQQQPWAWAAASR